MFAFACAFDVITMWMPSTSSKTARDSGSCDGGDDDYDDGGEVDGDDVVVVVVCCVHRMHKHISRGLLKQ